ncbi:type IV pilin protein [Chitinivibrio alkaliphilus]|uniref:Type IV pilin PilA n=1 Tax=Chitinivibrio alkaliphilus ACht1 TaxID=1313304 RepID=U7DBV2_9BACT|nr:prepilin-type N-terminal cleavage/methylation domain-containing protein [Chitinivibrio alkaliphilus]ERP31885.1 type IV pilin PilA [Chitinivibrio alkaliphilus ACht1]
MKQKGFTLVELMVVIVIIGIIAMLAIPNYLRYADRARTSEIAPTLRTINNAIWLDYSETGEWITSAEESDLQTLSITIPESKFFEYNISPGGGQNYRVYAVPKSGVSLYGVNEDDTVYIEDGVRGFAGTGFQPYIPGWE